MTQFQNLESKIGIKFNDHELYKRAFTHSSYLNEHREKGLKDNERLEFLGDAVLELVATRHLFETYADQDEGEMTAYRSALVKGEHLAEVAQELELGQYLRMSNGEEKSGGREKPAILADVTEALIGAIYLDQGYETADQFIAKFIMKALDKIITEGLHIDAKSRFQELCQDKEDLTPHYELISDEGPDHQKNFTMGAYIGDKLIAEGSGSSKQKAEEEAALKALKAKGWQ